MTSEANIDKTLTELKQTLVDLLGDRLERMVLFGSRARGDYTSDSDIDIAIVVKNLTRELKLRILDEIAAIELKHLVFVSTIILSEKDFNRLRERERRIALDIEHEGKPL